MIHLKPVEYTVISKWFVDYQKKSKNFEMPSEHAETIGIYRGEELIGYFIITNYENGINIDQGYLKPEARHKNLSRIAMGLLEKAVKQAGKKMIVLSTNRAVSSYQSFMRNMGFSLVKATFVKELN